jgi:acyl-ACP thioesterase
MERIITDMDRLKGIPDMREVDRITVPNSSIDMNGHVNNTEYIRWGIDTLRAEVPSRRSITSFSISYLSEVFKGELLILSLKETVPGKFVMSGTKEGSPKPAFMIEVDVEE